MLHWLSLVIMSKLFVSKIPLEEPTQSQLKEVLMLPKIIKAMGILSIDFFMIQLKVVIIDLEKKMFIVLLKSPLILLINALLKVFLLPEIMEDYLITDLLEEF